MFWHQERVKSESRITGGRIVYNICCKGGKIVLPTLADRTEPLSSLARFDGDARCR